MDFIKNNKELQEWLVIYITDSIHGFEQKILQSSISGLRISKKRKLSLS